MNNVQTIAEIFAGKLLQVPDYQRGYAWDEQNWNDFLDDLDLLEPGKDHYTGTLVLHAQGDHHQDDEGSKYDVFHIVDGQQRLTTVVLLVDVIRREVLAVDKPKLAEGIKKNYISVSDFHSGQPLFKLKLNEDTHDFFVNNVLSDDPGPEGPSIRSEARLIKAKKHFAAYLASQKMELGDEYEGWLLGLYNKVTSQLKVSLYNVSDTSEVGVIFEVMNDRGKPLSDLEKVKNYLLYVSSKLSIENHDLAERINKTWSNIFRRLMASGLVETWNEDQLLRVHWLISRDYQSKNWKGSKSVKERFSLKRYKGRHKELLKRLVEYTSSLDRASVPYCDVAKPGRPDAFASFEDEPALRRQIKAATGKLGRMRAVATFLPLLVAMRLRHPQDGTNFLELVRTCEVFAFRVYRLLERRANTGESTLRRLAYQMYSEDRPFEDLVEDLRGTLLYYCSDHEFEQAFELEEIENDWYRWAGLKYFLYKYELHLAEGQAVQMTWDDIEGKGLENTIEHILPQTANKMYWKTRFDKKARRKYTHDIGNLCLTYHNSSYGNKPFPEKKEQDAPHKPSYANSNLFQERRLSFLKDWNVKALEKRREEIVEWALTRWHVDLTTPAPPDPEEVDEQERDEFVPTAMV